MGRMVKLRLKKYISNNSLLYFFIIFFLIMGIVFGVLGVKALSQQQLASLNTYIETGLKSGTNIDYQSTIKYAVWRNIKTIFKIWFLGLTVIGLPLIIVIIFTRGFVLGFTVGFLLENKSWQGLGIILLTILPQNFFHLPALILAGASAITFSLHLVGRKRNDNIKITGFFLRYSIVMLIITLVMIIAGIVEGYVTPFATKII